MALQMTTKRIQVQGRIEQLLTVALFDTLSSRYGDEDRAMTLRKKELKKTGPKPDWPKEQVAWLTHGEVTEVVGTGGAE